MTTTVSLQIENIDLHDHNTMQVLGSHFAEFLWSSVDGRVTFTMYIDFGDVVAQVVRATREVEARLHGTRVRRVQRDLVSQSDIASRVGVSREAVRKWTRRTGDGSFPHPFPQSVGRHALHGCGCGRTSYLGFGAYTRLTWGKLFRTTRLWLTSMRVLQRWTPTWIDSGRPPKMCRLLPIPCYPGSVSSNPILWANPQANVHWRYQNPSGRRSMPEIQARPPIEFSDLESLVARTEVRDIRLQRFTGEVLRTPPESTDVRLTNSMPQYVIQEDSILALFTHRLDFEELSEASTEDQPVGYVETKHIVELELRGDERPSEDSVSALLATNVLFMVYPYVRAALQRLPVEFGLPPILLPYLRRDVSSEAHVDAEKERTEE